MFRSLVLGQSQFVLGVKQALKSNHNNMECNNTRCDYFYMLDSLHQLRYVNKLSAIGFLDPRSEMDNFVVDKDKYPDVTYPDIVKYMLFARSPLTRKELKCYTGLE